MWKKMLTPVIPNEHIKLCILDTEEFSLEQVKKIIKPTVGGALLDGLKLDTAKNSTKLYEFIRPCDFMMEPLSNLTNPAAIKMLNKEVLQYFLDGWEKAYPKTSKHIVRKIVEDFNSL